MSDENKIRDAAEALKGIAEAVPVYQDAIQPAAKEIGTALQTVAKTVRIALFPLRLAVWGYDQIEEWLLPKLAEKLRNVPEERIITPAPTVAGPALEALRFASSDVTLRELYANLLAKAMDSKTAREAHPAFVEILRQFTPDEAHLIAYLYQIRNSAIRLISGRLYVATKRRTTGYPVRHFSLLEQKAGCKYADLAESYIDNLCRLGLVEIFPPYTVRSWEIDDLWSYDQLEEVFKHFCLESFSLMLKAEGLEDQEILEVVPSFQRENLRLTSLGIQFCQACIVEIEAGSTSTWDWVNRV
jgi:hypothetical protein